MIRQKDARERKSSSVWSHWHAAVLMCINTLEGIMYGSVGDWIIRGVQGEIYPCKPDIFDQTYEAVE